MYLNVLFTMYEFEQVDLLQVEHVFTVHYKVPSEL